MIRTAVAALLVVAVPATAQAREVTVTLRPATHRPSTTFEGWGTALAWFAHLTGGWPDAERERLGRPILRPRQPRLALLWQVEGTDWNRR